VKPTGSPGVADVTSAVKYPAVRGLVMWPSFVCVTAIEAHVFAPPEHVPD